MSEIPMHPQQNRKDGAGRIDFIKFGDTGLIDELIAVHDENDFVMQLEIIATGCTGQPRHTKGSSMTHAIHDISVATQIGSYSDAVEAAPHLRWLMTSGTPGLSETANLPDDIAGQAELAWQNVVKLLSKAGMTVTDIVKVTQYLTHAEDIKAYAEVRSRFLGVHRPASMLLVIPQLVWPEILVEIEIIAAKAP